MLNLIREAAEAGIILHAENGQLQYRQLGNEFPDSIKQRVREQKADIIVYLTAQSGAGDQAENNHEVNIVTQLESLVKQTPNKISLYYGEDSTTYQQFGVQVEKLAKYIAFHAAGKPVALLIDRSINTMVAIYAALSANVPYVPIDPENPQDRIDYFLKDAQSKLLLTDQHYIDLPNHFEGKTAVICDILAATEELNVTLPEASKIDERSAAYIIYTSGSTGKPKGVVCSHQNLSHFGKVMQQQFVALGLDEDSKWLWNASYAFDASIKAVVALAQGRPIVVPNELDVKDPKALTTLITNQNIQVVNAAPILMGYILPHLELTGTHVHIIVSGDDVDKQLWAKLYEYSKSCGRKVINAYGPTEASVNASFEIQADNEVVSIGKAVVDTQFYVLDDNGQGVAEGEEGQLYIAGAGVALGYLNRDEETEANFVILPESQTRAFKTGDIVKLLSGGKLQFAWRNDNQVKYRGYRVELDEIKASLKRCDGLIDAAVITTKDGGGLRIEAYLVTAETVPSVVDIQQYLDKTLPEYMHPTKLHFVAEIPLTSGGKIDKSRLTAAKPANDNNEKSTGTDVASRLTVIWLEVLDISEIDTQDNFFKVGGHSLRAMQLLQMIDTEFGLAMAIRELFSLLTLQSQIDWITENSTSLEVELAEAACSIESRLRIIWLDCLALESFENTENFFKLGGHSLLAMKLLADMQEEFGVAMDIRSLFSHLEFNVQVEWLNAAVATIPASEYTDDSADMAAEESDSRVELEL
ncbi:MAG: amino acid adenylation domain-containing protein [Colwellia sp.]|nr:amino acid adenylation domain-containing protein [Colwellia sp.]